MNWMKTTVVALSLSLTGATAMAQNVSANNLISVQLSNVANNLAQNLSVDVSNIPVTVQVPIGIAATICNIEANVLATGGNDTPGSCTASSTSDALTKIVQRSMG